MPTYFSNTTLASERPPRLIQHVLTVLVFWSWVLLLPRLPPSSRSLRLFPWASILLHGPLDICSRSSPTIRAKPGRTAHVFTAQGGTRRFREHKFLFNKNPSKTSKFPGKLDFFALGPVLCRGPHGAAEIQFTEPSCGKTCGFFLGSGKHRFH